MKLSAFFDAVRLSLSDGKLTQHQVDVFNEILNAWGHYGDDDMRKLAYILATAWHETGRFRWLKEIWGPTAAQKRYEGRKDLGNTLPGDGKRFMGRGLVHITGRANYSDWAKRLNVDIVADPEKAERLDVAARILVQGCMLGTFTGKKLGDYTAFKDMRRVVNGTDKADLIAGYAAKFEQAIDQAEYGSEKPVQPQKPTPAPSGPEPDDTQPKSGLGAIVAVIIAMGVALYAFAKSQGIPLP